MKLKLKSRPQGFFLPLSVAFIGVLMASVIAMVFMFKFNTKNSLYLQNMNMTYRLAEVGLNEAMRQLTTMGDIADFDTKPVPKPELNGYFQNSVLIRTEPVNPVFYVVTSATRTFHGHSYSTRLHAYVRVSNTNEYFAAIFDSLTLSHPVDIATGKVYASSLTFVTDGNPATLTLLKKAEYVDDCSVQDFTTGVTTPWADASKADVHISVPVTGDPTHLAAPLVFPQVLGSDIVRYRNIAGPHTVTSNFAGEIYPPGYSNYTSNSAGDKYPLHKTDNRQHVYFYDGDLTVGGVVHGQVLFVATGDIYISKDLKVATDNDLPGFGSEYGSRAHQVVLITPKNVIIKNNMAVDLKAQGGTTQFIQAMIIAPHGSLLPQSYGDEVTHAALHLNFTGSMVLATLSGTPRLPEVFLGGRVYGYMDTLRTAPPPYLPSVSEIYSYLEETGQSWDGAFK